MDLRVVRVQKKGTEQNTQSQKHSMYSQNTEQDTTKIESRGVKIVCRHGDRLKKEEGRNI